MKHRTSLTEKILWAIYEFMELGSDILTIFPSRVEDWVYHDYYLIRKKVSQEKRYQEFANLISYLKRKGLIKIKIEKNKKGIILTPKGTEKVLQIFLKRKNRKKRKDGKWQMVIFDIPEKERKNRDQFRRSLKFLGYQQLQKSIWVSAYDILKETEKLIRMYSLEPYVKLLLIEEIEF